MISRIALVAAAGMMLGTAIMPAKAADLGGGCCADLEERVAELEATVARKGNRVVSLQIYGDVTKGLLIWDNGRQSDAYVTDNDALGSVLGFTGEAKFKPGWKAGYKMELQVQVDASSAVDELHDDATNLSIRHNYVYIESERLGRISLGQQSTASDGAAEVSLANTLASGSPDQGTALHPGGLLGFTGTTPNFAGLTLGEYASDLDGGRDDLIRYDSPSIYGFVLSAAWGDNDYWDASLRFTKEWNSIKIAAAIAYADSSTEDADFTQVIGSVSVMHVPTGLFINFGTGERDWANDVDASFYFVQGGIERKWLPYGTTTVYGEYGNYDDITVAGTNADMWGLGVVQHIDAAAMDIYAQARFWSVDDDLAPEADKLNTIMLGSRIQF
jgi:predicted porin